MAKAKDGATDALKLLKQDHDSVKKAFKEFEKMDHEDHATMQEFVRAVCEELKAHTTIEEEIFYPAVREEIEDEDLMNEAQVEHDSARQLIEQLESMEADDPLYAATFTVLGEYVNHHIEEEESEMFKEVRKSELDLEALGRQMMERKQALLAEA
jgi:hemerythrin-like domain-containing protein